jgi:hypothetical protein
MTSENVTFSGPRAGLESAAERRLIARCLIARATSRHETAAGEQVGGDQGDNQGVDAAVACSLRDLKVKGAEFSGPANRAQGWQEFLRLLPIRSRRSGPRRAQSDRMRRCGGSRRAATDISREHHAHRKMTVLVYIDGDRPRLPVKVPA